MAGCICGANRTCMRSASEMSSPSPAVECTAGGRGAPRKWKPLSSSSDDRGAACWIATATRRNAACYPTVKIIMQGRSAEHAERRGAAGWEKIRSWLSLHDSARSAFPCDCHQLQVAQTFLSVDLLLQGFVAQTRMSVLLGYYIDSNRCRSGSSWNASSMTAAKAPRSLLRLKGFVSSVSIWA